MYPNPSNENCHLNYVDIGKRFEINFFCEDMRINHIIIIIIIIIITIIIFAYIMVGEFMYL